MLNTIEITGDGSTKSLAQWAAADAGYGGVSVAIARPVWVQLLAGQSNSGTARVGDVTTSVSRGLPLIGGAGQEMDPVAHPGGYIYSLANIYVYVASSDTVSVCFSI